MKIFISMFIHVWKGDMNSKHKPLRTIPFIHFTFTINAEGPKATRFQ